VIPIRISPVSAVVSLEMRSFDFLKQYVQHMYVVDDELEAAYRSMAADQKRETWAIEWTESLIADVSDGGR